MKYHAFIGTRRLDAVHHLNLERYMDEAKKAVEEGYTVISGGAKGADARAMTTAILTGGLVIGVLPWASYEHDYIHGLRLGFPAQFAMWVYDPDKHPEWRDSVAKYHPAPHALRQSGHRLHARNYGIISVAEKVTALSVDETGGTGQGIRIARALGKPLLSLMG
jgi:hypothetical protein